MSFILCKIRLYQQGINLWMYCQNNLGVGHKPYIHQVFALFSHKVLGILQINFKIYDRWSDLFWPKTEMNGKLSHLYPYS